MNTVLVVLALIGRIQQPQWRRSVDRLRPARPLT